MSLTDLASNEQNRSELDNVPQMGVLAGHVTNFKLRGPQS